MTDKTQPEALRLADELAQRWGENMACPELEAAAELRRLHAENERLSGLCDKWNSECDEFREDNKRLAALVEAQQHTRIAELEAARFAYASEFDPNGDGYPDVGSIHANIRAMKAKLASIGAGGAQALSAAPASPWSRALEIRMAQGWKLKGDRVPVLYTDSINGEGVGRDDLWLCTTGALAASPTPPAEQPIGEVVVTKTKDGQIVAVTRQDDEGRILSVIATSDPEEQQATPKAAPASVAGQMQFGGCPECGSRSCLARQCSRTVSHSAQATPGVQWMCGQQASGFAAPQQEAQEPATVPYQKLTNEIDLILSDQDTDLSIGAKRALLWMRTWVSVPLYTAPQQPATHVQNPAEIEHVAGNVSKTGPESNMAQQPAPSAAAASKAVLKAIREANMQLVRTGGDAFMLVPYKVATTGAALGAEQAAPKAAPQQEAQKPVAWYEYNADLDAWFLAYRRNPKAKTRPLVFGDATPQPAPAPLSRDQIREVFMAHGFTIKEGQTDLKQYVYDAAYALLGAKPAPLSDTEKAVRQERERLCAAIKAEDDYCIDNGDYMLDSDDCIKIVKGEWVRPDFSAKAAIAAQGGRDAG